MEQYIEKFKAFVLSYLKKNAKRFNLKINQSALGFYLGKVQTEEDVEQEDDAPQQEEQYGVGFILAQGVIIENHVVTTVFDGDRCFFQVSTDDEGKPLYEWSFHASNAACYGSYEAAQQVIDSLKLDGAEIMYIGNSEDVAAWKAAYPNDYAPTDDVEFKQLEYPTIEQILDLVVDPFNYAGAAPSMIMNSLLMLCEQHGIDKVNLRVYAVPSKDGEDLSVHVFNVEEYVCESSLHELMLPMLPK